MTQIGYRTLSLLTAIGLLLSACGNATATAPTPDTNAIATAVVQTVEAQNTVQALIELATRVANLPTPEPATATPAVAQGQVSPTPEATNVSYEYKPGCVYATFVADISIIDGTIMAPGTEFTKTWRIKNSGSCKWDGRFTLVFFSGDKMGETTSIPIPRVVYPGQEVDFSITLTAPSSYGTYTGQWRLGTPVGTAGVGQADQNLLVSIEVSDKPQRDFAVTNVAYTIVKRDPQNGCNSGRIKATYTYVAEITVNAPGDVKYEWARTPFDGVHEDGNLHFATAGSKSVTWTWTMTDDTIQSIDRQIWIITTTEWDTVEWPRQLFNFHCP